MQRAKQGERTKNPHIARFTDTKYAGKDSQKNLF